MSEELPGDEDGWRERLSPDQYRILRQAGTEPPFSGTYNHHHERGCYLCAACGAELFESQHKFDSGSGWPSFWAPHSEEAVVLRSDASHGMQRVEVRCARCGGHLGHIFEDGPPPTGQRYCINSLALQFVTDEKGGGC